MNKSDSAGSSIFGKFGEILSGWFHSSSSIPSIRCLGLIFFLLVIHSSVSGQVPSPRPLRSSDSGYTGAPITLRCDACTLPLAVQSIAAKARIRLKFENSEQWNRIAVTLNINQEPWDQVLDELLPQYRLRAVWVGEIVMIVPGEHSAPRGLEDGFEWFEDLPPLPEESRDLSPSARANEARRLMSEVFALNNSKSSDRRKILTKLVWAYQLYESVEYRGRQALCLFQMSEMLRSGYRSDQALEALVKAVPYAQVAGDKSLEALLKVQIANLSVSDVGNPDDVLDLADETSRMVFRILAEDQMRVSENRWAMTLAPVTLSELGILYFRLDEHKKSFDCFQRELQYLQSQPDPDADLRLLTWTGLEKTSQLLDRKVEAKLFQGRIADFVRSIVGQEEKFARTMDLVDLNVRFGDLREAARRLDEAGAMLVGLKDYRHEIRYHQGKGILHSLMRQPEEAQKAFEKAVEVCRTNKDPESEQDLVKFMKMLRAKPQSEGRKGNFG